MNEKKAKELFFELYNAPNEHEVERILSNNEFLKKNEHWKPYGGNDNNFGTFENQQNHPVPALVEKITNSIDACLMKKCHEFAINPQSNQAPKTMYKAVEKFYGIKDCNINDLTKHKRREIAENIQIIATGDKGQPNIRIYDNGEGQLPQKFKDTFLSLHTGNKVKVPFAQGKYNMGSTGAVVFCGDKKYQLIGSKRANDDNAKFGFTLVRKHQLTELERKENPKSTWYEYLTILGEIACFSIDKLDLGLKNRDFETGTIIQLYSFQTSHGIKGDISTDLYRSFNQYFYDLPIPFLVYETRYGNKINNKVIKGNRNRIDDDINNNVDHTFVLEFQTNLGLAINHFQIPVHITVFKKQPNNEQDRQFIGHKNLVFTLNGQVHGFEGQSFISQDLGFSLLKRSTLIAIDCNYLPVDVMQELFMSNRTHLKQGKLAERLRAEITSKIKQDKTLKQINEQRKKDLIGKSDSKDFNDVIGMLPKSSEVFDFLKKDSLLPFSKQKTKSQQSSNKKSNKSKQKELNRFPSQFKLKLKDNEDGKKLKTIPLNQNGHVDIKTDVQDNYLFRSADTGELKIDILQKTKASEVETKSKGKKPDTPAKSIKVDRSGPTNGNIRLDIQPTKDAKIGDEVEVVVSLTSPSENFTCRFDVRVDSKITPPKNVQKKEKTRFPNPPVPRKAYQNPDNEEDLRWDNENLNWTGADVVKVIGGSEQNDLLVEAIVVNMDSFVLNDFIHKNKYTKEKDIERISNKYFKLIYTHSLGLYSICTKMNHKKSKNIEDDASFNIQQVDDFISSLTKSYASYLLYMDLHNEKLMKELTADE